jgi:hypothetical protein
MHLRRDCGQPREQTPQDDETSHTVARLIEETSPNRVVSHARGRVNDELGAKATPGLGHPCGILRRHRCAAAVQWLTADLADRSVPRPAPSHCWHDICNAMIRGEHMSYKRAVSTNRELFERQQEKLHIAREALARVEAKYVQKQDIKHPLESRAKLRCQQPHANR